MRLLRAGEPLMAVPPAIDGVPGGSFPYPAEETNLVVGGMLVSHRNRNSVWKVERRYRSRGGRGCSRGDWSTTEERTSSKGSDCVSRRFTGY